MDAISSGLIVGYGSIGARHAANLRHLLPALPLTLVTQRTDVGGERTHVVRKLSDAISERPSFAVIASPSHLHSEHLLELLEARVPCYVEKPAAVSFEQLHQLQERLSRMSEVPATLVGCNLRFLPSLVRMRFLLQSGAIGRPIRAGLQAGQWLPDWRPARDYGQAYSADARRGGGVILDLIHEIDQARWLFGEFDEVHALAGKLSSLNVQTEDCACLLLGRRMIGPIVSIGLDYVSRRAVRRYDVVGEAGSLTWDLHARRLDCVGATGGEEIDCGPGAFDVGQTYLAAMSRFLDCVTKGCADTALDIHDGLRTTALALQARASAGL